MTTARPLRLKNKRELEKWQKKIKPVEKLTELTEIEEKLDKIEKKLQEHETRLNYLQKNFIEIVLKK